MAFHISDQHFFHSNIIKYCNRPFKDINEMNYFMIEKWNEVVGINDIIYHHGDFCLGGKNNASSILSVLNGYKILIKGNH
ncbi:MAG: metallophosphatase, partial [bacterium]